jgi:hypothetical protein
MNKLSFFLIGLTLLATSCKKDSASDSSNSIGGSTAIALNTVGNEFAGYVKLGTSIFDGGESIKITSVSNGITTVNCTGTIPANTPLTDLVPASFKDGTGKLNVNLKFKNTSEGILYYTMEDNQPFTLVKYDASVGDKYILNKSDGKKITRTVTAKSTTDDYLWGGMLIKTVTVEQDSRIPGVCSIVYQANHRFGLVSVKIIMDDDSTYELVLSPTTY